MEHFAPSSQDLLDRKQDGENPFVCEIRHQAPDVPLLWVSDRIGSFELEQVIGSDDDWFRIQFAHNRKSYEADVNVYHKDNGELCVNIHAVDFERKTMGGSFIKLSPTIIPMDTYWARVDKEAEDKKKNIKMVQITVNLPILINPDVDNEQLVKNIKNHLVIHFADDSDTQTAHDSFEVVAINLNA